MIGGCGGGGGGERSNGFQGTGGRISRRQHSVKG